MKRKGYTLVEALIVMGIIAVLLSLGFVGLTQFQATIELQNAYNDLASLMKTIENNARNSTIVNETSITIPDIYILQIEEGVYKTKVCEYQGTSTTNLLCQNQENLQRSVRFSRVEISTSNCNAVGFKRLTGDIVAIDFEPSVPIVREDLDTCELKLRHQGTTGDKTISIDFLNNDINL